MVNYIQFQAALTAVIVCLSPAFELVLSSGHDQQPEIGPLEDAVKEGHLDIGLQGDFFSIAKPSVYSIRKRLQPLLPLFQLFQIYHFLTDVF